MIGSKTYGAGIAPAAAPRSRMARRHCVLLGSLALLLMTAVILQTLPYPKSAVVERTASLADYFPQEMAGWRGEDHPLAETEATAGAVKEILNYNEALLRFYRKGGREFSIYVAYWQPGRMSSREIAFHIPDKCWPTVGWKRTAADYHYQRELEGRLLAPAQYREFEQADQKQYVLYWHIFNGRAITYNPNGSPSDLSMLTDLFQRGLRQRGEQYFIRLASPTPIDELWNDEGFQEILELIAPLGPGLHASVERFEGTP
ncbi:MAG TPA: exosortase-associated EpsI family protein [Opitutaceae bacterium]|jgi:hypothetical protein|nr:exosortase-associated EpsI family protein [Opitutaceae bacterium]